ncbi:MAG: DUF523 and DUF1722 domain-containing protein [Actinomycetota bacterium]
MPGRPPPQLKSWEEAAAAAGPPKPAARRAADWLTSVPSVRVGVSACLLGQNVRWDGGNKADLVVQALGGVFKWIPVCPEIEVGMGAPREPLRLVQRRGMPRMLGVETGDDWTDEMVGYATDLMQRWADMNVRGWILKSRSPSCGLGDVPVYARDGSVAETNGRGLFAKVLAYRMPLLPIAEESALQDFDRAASFVDEVLGYDRLLRFVRKNPDRNDLVRFQGIHELTLLSRGSQQYRRLAHLAAAGRGTSQKENTINYSTAFMRALKLPASRANHARALRRASFQAEHAIKKWDKAEIDKAIGAYTKGEAELSLPVGLLKQQITTGASWLGSQSYFDPCPPEVLLETIAG